MIFRWFRNRRRKKLLNQPWPEPWSLHLNRNVRLTWELSKSETQQLQKRIKVFVGEKNWEGCEGLEITDEIRVTIAAQACLMLMGNDHFYFDNVRSVLVFPKSFARKTSDGQSEGMTQHRAGEAWQNGPIILSWRDSLRGGRNEDDGQNVVIHEFAHALDGLDGEMGGTVMFEDADSTQQWQEVVSTGFKELCLAKERGHRTLLDHYGATNPAEYFAVASETFFEQPVELNGEHPELFRLLKKYFGVDPTAWQRKRR